MEEHNRELRCQWNEQVRRLHRTCPISIHKHPEQSLSPLRSKGPSRGDSHAQQLNLRQCVTCYERRHVWRCTFKEMMGTKLHLHDGQQNHTLAADHTLQQEGLYPLYTNPICWQQVGALDLKPIKNLRPNCVTEMHLSINVILQQGEKGQVGASLMLNNQICYSVTCEETRQV